MNSGNLLEGELLRQGEGQWTTGASSESTAVRTVRIVWGMVRREFGRKRVIEVSFRAEHTNHTQGR